MAFGEVFSDALSGAPVAGKLGGPLLLVRGASDRARLATAAGVVAVPFMYLGMLCTSYQFTG